MAAERAITVLDDPDRTRARIRAAFSDEEHSRVGDSLGAWSMADFQS